MKKAVYITCFLLAFLLTSCEYRLKPFDEDGSVGSVVIERFDRVESRYLTTGDFSALQQMSTEYAQPMRLLIEDMLLLGNVQDQETNSRLLSLYQDSLLQQIIVDVEEQYATTDDLDRQLSKAFARLKEFQPDVTLPVVYAQVGALKQSIIVDEDLIGISLDKYLGSDYPPYAVFFDEQQRVSMSREYIVPDCMVFYLISRYPLTDFEARTVEERECHLGRIMYVANQLLGERFFTTDAVAAAEKLAKKKHLSPFDILGNEPLTAD